MRKPEPQPEDNTDPFDRLYKRWAEHAIGKRTDPPSRERWDQIVSFLLQSEDPERRRRYSYIESYGSETLGADAYALWEKMPEYTENRSVPAATWPELNAYEELHRGSMARLMQAQGK